MLTTHDEERQLYLFCLVKQWWQGRITYPSRREKKNSAAEDLATVSTWRWTGPLKDPWAAHDAPYKGPRGSGRYYRFSKLMTRSSSWDFLVPLQHISCVSLHSFYSASTLFPKPDTAHKVLSQLMWFTGQGEKRLWVLIRRLLGENWTLLNEKCEKKISAPAVHVCGSQQNHRICSQTATFPAIYFAVNSQRIGLACLNKDVTGERTGKKKWFPRQHCKYNCLQRMQEEQRTCFSTFSWQCIRSQGSAQSQVGNEQRQKHSREQEHLETL